MFITKHLRFAYKVHLLEESRTFYMMHLKKLEWFNKLTHEEKSQKALVMKNKYKVNKILG